MMRSQMAEAFYNALTDSNNASSAGATAEFKDQISSRAIEAMRDIGYNVTHLKPKQLNEEMVDTAGKVIYFPSNYMPDYVKQNLKSELWNVVDPHYHKEQGMELVRQVRDDIKMRVENLVRDTV